MWSSQVTLSTSRQWWILIWRSGLAEGYTVWHCAVLLDRTSGSGFGTVSRPYLYLKLGHMWPLDFRQTTKQLGFIRPNQKSVLFVPVLSQKIHCKWMGYNIKKCMEPWINTKQLLNKPFHCTQFLTTQRSRYLWVSLTTVPWKSIGKVKCISRHS